jgi:hypothetical protein
MVAGVEEDARLGALDQEAKLVRNGRRKEAGGAAAHGRRRGALEEDTDMRGSCEDRGRAPVAGASTVGAASSVEGDRARGRWGKELGDEALEGDWLVLSRAQRRIQSGGALPAAPCSRRKTSPRRCIARARARS